MNNQIAERIYQEIDNAVEEINDSNDEALQARVSEAMGKLKFSIKTNLIKLDQASESWIDPLVTRLVQSKYTLRIIGSVLLFIFISGISVGMNF